MKYMALIAASAIIVGGGGTAEASSMPLAGARVVAADEFWTTTTSWPPSLMGTDVNWGLAAAQDLTNALCKVLGREVPLFRESEVAAGGGATVYLGPTKAAASAGLDAKPMMAGEWRIKCDGRKAFILARTGMGTAYGVTDFLERFAGYRFLSIDGDDPWETKPRAAVPECDFTKKHYFYERHFSVCGRITPDTNRMHMNAYMRRLGLYLSPEVEERVKPSLCVKLWCHTYLCYVPPEKYFADHPEYFSMDENGRRVNGPRTMLCLSNPDVRRIVKEKMLEHIEKERAEMPDNPPVIYDFSQTDGIYYICKCPECEKIAAKYASGSGYEFGCVSERESALQLDFVNELARAVGAKYPDVRIRTFAYVNTSMLPKGIAPEPNVMPWFCDWYVHSDHQLPLEHPFNSWCRKHLEDWCAASPSVELWDYMLYTDKFPEVSVDAIAADARLFKRLGVSRFYMECQYAGQPFWELNNYVYSKFFRDPDANLEKTIDEYCAVYGAGAAQMRKAIDFLRKITLENPPKSPDAWHDRALPWRTVENMETFGKFVRGAFAAERRPKPRARIARVLECADKELARLYKTASGADARREEIKDEWRAAMRAVYAGGLFAGKDRAKMLKRSEDEFAAADFKVRRLPDALKAVPENEIIGLGVRATVGTNTGKCKRVADPDSECDLVARVVADDSAVVPECWALIRDPENRQCDEFKFKLEKSDGYRWYRLGVSRVGRAGDCRLPSLSFRFADYYVECDGMAEDPNWYEFWISVKYNGDKNSKDETKGVFVDRLLMRRVKGRK